MKRRLFMTAFATSLAIPVAVASVPFNVEASQKEFTDVPKTNSFYKQIREMSEQGIIYGYTDGTFKPQQAISRMHVAVLFERSLDLVPVRAGKEFKDVPKTHSAYEAVQKVYRAGIFDGDTNGNFGIADNLTRAQMAKVLHNAFVLETHTGYIFSDVGESHWAKDYIASLYMSGITVGSNGKYLPNDSVTRAHFAVFLYRALNPDEAPKPEKPLQPTPPVVLSHAEKVMIDVWGESNVKNLGNSTYQVIVNGKLEMMIVDSSARIINFDNEATVIKAAHVISRISGKLSPSEVLSLMDALDNGKANTQSKGGVKVFFASHSYVFSW